LFGKAVNAVQHQANEQEFDSPLLVKKETPVFNTDGTVKRLYQDDGTSVVKRLAAGTKVNRVISTDATVLQPTAEHPIVFTAVWMESETSPGETEHFLLKAEDVMTEAPITTTTTLPPVLAAANAGAMPTASPATMTAPPLKIQAS